MNGSEIAGTDLSADSVKKGRTLSLDIEKLAFGGRGLARVGGMVVFVDHALPGDRVSAVITRKRKGYAEARLVEIIRPSSFRITPECCYHGYCGGCRLQTLDYSMQLEYKRQQVAETLAHIALMDEVAVNPVIPSEPVFGYRNKMEFSFSDRRWLLPEEMGSGGVDAGFALGLHVPGTFYKVLDTKRCLLMPELGNLILEDVRTYVKKSGVPVYGLRTHKGFWRFLMLRYSVAMDNWMVNIVTATEEIPVVMPLADMLFDKYGKVVSVVNNITASKAGVALGEREINLRGDPFIVEKLGRFRFEVSANSFLQTNTRAAVRLYDVVRKFAGLSGREKVVDLYSGIGTIAIWLSDSANEVIGLESNPSCVSDAEKNRELNGVKNVKFMAGDVKATLSSLGNSREVMVIDPPRAGMHQKVVKQVMEMGPRTIVYVSCNPATLARDIGMLKDGYMVAEVQPVDMFPHTFHIETVVRLVKR